MAKVNSYSECDDKVEDVTKGYIHLGLAVVYLIAEALLIWKTYTWLRRTDLRKDISMIILYIAIHLLFLRSIFNLLENVLLCYPRELHLIIDEYLFILKRFTFLIFIYRMICAFNTLSDSKHSDIMFEGEDNQRKDNIVWSWLVKKGYFTIVIGVIDFICYNIFFFTHFKEEDFHSWIMYYDLVVDTLIMLIFFKYWYTIKKYFNNFAMFEQPGQARQGVTEKDLLCVMFLIVLAMYIMHSHYGLWVLSVSDVSYSSNLTEEILLGVYAVIYHILTELIPSGAILFYSTKYKSEEDNDTGTDNTNTISSTYFD